MNTITTKDITHETIHIGNQTEDLHIYDELSTPVTADVLLLSHEHRQAIEDFAAQALQVFGPASGHPEPTHAQRNCGVATLLGRVDCTIQNGNIVPYELEDSPSGIGIVDLLTRRANDIGIQDRVLQHFDSEVGDVPFVLVSGARRHGTDDAVVFGEDRYHFQAGSLVAPHKLPAKGPVIVKAIPGVPESQAGYVHLSSRAVAPLLTEGDKTYAERLGLLQTVLNEADLLHDETGALRSQALKARVGSMALGISIYLEPEHRRRFGKRGLVTASRLTADLERRVQRDGSALVQPFAPPIQIENKEQRTNMILRVFVTARTSETGAVETHAIGGCFVARPELVVHGASNSVGGAILVQ